MKIAKSILSILLSVAILSCTLLFPNASAQEDAVEDVDSVSICTVEDYEAFVTAQAEKNSTNQLYRFLRTVRFLFRAMTGQLIYKDKNLEFEIDERLTEICDYINRQSGLDISRILTNLPDSSKPAELIGKVIGLNPTEIRDALYQKRDELHEQGEDVKGELYHVLGAYFGIIEKAEVFTTPSGAPDEYQLAITITFRDGTSETIHLGFYINEKTGEAYNNNDDGILSLGYNCSIYDLLIYAPVHVWMRNFGFCLFYDCFVYSLPDWMMYYNTRRFHFDYDGREWMIQAWKGHYLCTNGGEIGIYNRDAEKFGSFYNCAADEDMLEMTMTISHEGEQLFTVGPKKHWWITGFKISPVLFEPKTLTMNASIVMKDEAMLKAFCESIDRNIYHDVTYTVDGLTVNLAW